MKILWLHIIYYKMFQLPYEIQQEILKFTDFETCVKLKDDYLANKFYNPIKHTWNWAAIHGHLDIVKWLHEHHIFGCTKMVMNLVAKNGHLQIIKWLHENRSEGATESAMNWAAMNGHLDVVTWLHEHNKRCTTYAMDHAAENGHLQIVKYLHENRTEGCTVWAMIWASMNGHFEIFRYLHENRTVGYTMDAMNKLNINDRTKIISYLYKNHNKNCNTCNDKYLCAKLGKIECLYDIELQQITNVPDIYNRTMLYYAMFCNQFKLINFWILKSDYTLEFKKDDIRCISNNNLRAYINMYMKAKSKDKRSKLYTSL